jgi:hypothetical protein
MTDPTAATATSRTFDPSDLPDIDREKIRVNSQTGCWEWTASLTTSGYGQVNRGRRNKKAHRHIYEQLVRELEPVDHLDHVCRVRHCVNPAHLEVVEPLENSRRGISAIRAEVPADLLRGIERLVAHAYRRGVYDGMCRAKGQKP